MNKQNKACFGQLKFLVRVSRCFLDLCSINTVYFDQMLANKANASDKEISFLEYTFINI